VRVPRFYFHVQDGSDYPDLQGTMLDDLDAARREAVRFAGSLLAEKPDEFWQSGEWVVRVTDATNLTLFELRFFATDAAATGRSGVDRTNLAP
jgi:hypothetical protein